MRARLCATVALAVAVAATVVVTHDDEGSAAGHRTRLAGAAAKVAASNAAAAPASIDLGPDIADGIEVETQPDTISIADFVEPPMWARPQAYWLPERDQNLTESIRQLRAFKAAGLGGVTFEPGGVFDRVDTAGPSIGVPGWPMPHLSDTWFEYMDGMLEEAERLDMKTFLIDVPFTMSGGGDGRVAEPIHGGDPSLGWTTLDEVVPGQVYKQVTRPYWIDPLNPAAVDKLITEVYDLHKDKLGQHFGKALQAMWTDEVSFQPTVSPNTFRNFTPRFPEIPWSPTFPAYFEDRWGYELTPELLNRVFSHRLTDPEDRRVSHDYWEAVSARFADVYYGGLARWSSANGVGFVGQLLAEEDVPGHVAAEGSYFRPAAQPTIASTDLITGNMDLAGTPWCDGQSCYGLTMKLISSAAHLFGRNRAHIEFLDLADEEIKSRPAMLRAMIDHAVARGINYFAPHSYDYAGGGYNFGDPLFEYQRPVNDYMGRLSYMFSNGTSLPDLAVGYAPETSWVGGNWNNNVLSLTSAVLASEKYELDHVPVELFTDPALTINDGSFTFGTQTYRSLVVPDWGVASLDVIERVAEFVRRGGTLGVVGRLPAYETRGNDAALTTAMTDLFGFAPTAAPTTFTDHAHGAGRVLWMPGDFTQDIGNLTPARVAALDPFMAALRSHAAPNVSVAGGHTLPSGLSATEVYPYRRAGGDTYMVTNFPKWSDKFPPKPGTFSHNFASQPATVTIEVPATGAPELWDAQTGEVTRIRNYTVTADNRLRVHLSLPEFGSRVLRLNPTLDPATEAHITATNLRDASVNGAGHVVGYAPLGLTGPAFADVVVGGIAQRAELASPATAAQTAYPDTVYDIEWTEGDHVSRKAGSWNSLSLDPLLLPRTPWYSDAGTYTATIDVPHADAADGRIILDLGGVGDAARVTLNGEPLGIAQFPPYSFGVTDAARPGGDALSVRVKQSRAGGFPTGDPVWPAGLLGPVTSRFEPLIDLGIPA